MIAEIKIKLSREDILAGHEQVPEKCPIRLAVTRHFSKPNEWALLPQTASVSNNDILLADEEGNNLTLAGNDAMETFIRDFDREGPEQVRTGTLVLKYEDLTASFEPDAA